MTVSPKHDGGLLGSVELAWDAAHGVPLRDRGLRAGRLLAGARARGDRHLLRAGLGERRRHLAARRREGRRARLEQGRGSHGRQGRAGDRSRGVQAAAGFPVVAPDTLVGLPRKDVRLVGGADSGSLVVYGQGLGAIVVVERKADATAPKGGALASLPTVSLDGVTAHELATQLGTVIEWQSGGVAYVLAGSLPPAAAEAAARTLK